VISSDVLLNWVSPFLWPIYLVSQRHMVMLVSAEYNISMQQFIFSLSNLSQLVV